MTTIYNKQKPFKRHVQSCRMRNFQVQEFPNGFLCRYVSNCYAEIFSLLKPHDKSFEVNVHFANRAYTSLHVITS